MTILTTALRHLTAVTALANIIICLSSYGILVYFENYRRRRRKLCDNFFSFPNVKSVSGQIAAQGVTAKRDWEESSRQTHPCEVSARVRAQKSHSAAAFDRRLQNPYSFAYQTQYGAYWLFCGGNEQAAHKTRDTLAEGRTFSRKSM